MTYDCFACFLTHNTTMICIAETRQIIFLLDILMPHMNFNKSQPTFYGVAGNIGLTLSEE